LWKNSYVKTGVLIAIILVGVVGFWFGLQTGLRTQYPLLAVASGSMVPTLNVGDMIVVQGVSNFSSVKAGLWHSATEGDVVVFYDPRPQFKGQLIVHRLVRRIYDENDGLWYFQTEGDHNGVPDEWYGPNTLNYMISQTIIVGRVVGVVPWIGNIPLYIRSPQGIVIIVVLFLIIILAEYVPSMSKKPEPQQS
jgi:signal peptidase